VIDLREPLSTLINLPASFAGKRKFSDRITIYDETLRDGEQMPGVAFTPEQKLALARQLSDLGVGVMMAAFPVSSAADKLAFRRLLKARREGEIRKDIELICIARANKRDIDIIAEIARESTTPLEELGILILSTTSDLHLKYKLGKTLLKFSGESEDAWLDLPPQWYRDTNVDFIVRHVAYAKSLGFGSIEFAGEDASRGNRDYLLRWAAACAEAGGTRLCFSDTCGVLTPESVDYYFAGLPEALPGLQITAHFHNDFGLAAINTVRALSHGATHASITACGIGERAGNASIHQVVMLLRELYGVVLDDFRYDLLWSLRDTVERATGVPISVSEPIIGNNVFSHESGIHTAGVRIHPAIYQSIDEKLVGGIHRFVYGKHSGRDGIQHLFDKVDLTATVPDDGPAREKLVEEVLSWVKTTREEMAKTAPAGAFIDQYYARVNGLGLSEHEVAAKVSDLARPCFKDVQK
jgi:isopropylmalate/homocitrate/citramalate synthase